MVNVIKAARILPMAPSVHLVLRGDFFTACKQPSSCLTQQLCVMRRVLLLPITAPEGIYSIPHYPVNPLCRRSSGCWSSCCRLCRRRTTAIRLIHKWGSGLLGWGAGQTYCMWRHAWALQSVVTHYTHQSLPESWKMMRAMLGLRPPGKRHDPR